jgi:hypothetical protein
MTWYLRAYYSGKSAGKRCGVQIVVIEAVRGLELENLNERCGYRQGDADEHEGRPRSAHAGEGHDGPQDKSEGVVRDGDDDFAVAAKVLHKYREGRALPKCYNNTER